MTALAGERSQAEYLLAIWQIQQSHAAAGMCWQGWLPEPILAPAPALAPEELQWVPV